MESATILLVEDNPNDEALTFRALRKIMSEIKSLSPVMALRRWISYFAQAHMPAATRVKYLR
jgi:hypothetical protein